MAGRSLNAGPLATPPKAEITPKHLRWKLSSPTAKTSSRSSASASRKAAIEKPRRIVIPEEYVRTGKVKIRFVGLAFIAGVFVLVLVGEFALEFLQTTTLQMTGQRIMFDLRMQVFEHLQRLDLRFYDRNPVGRLMTRVTTDVDAVRKPKLVPILKHPLSSDWLASAQFRGIQCRLKSFAPAPRGPLPGCLPRDESCRVPAPRSRLPPC